MKILIYFFAAFLLLVPMQMWGQEDEAEPVSVLESPEDWTPEVIPFPLGFAPELAYQGVEELRFAKSWSDSTSERFWAYAFVWYLEEDPKLDAGELESAIQLYYNGLMTAVGKKHGFSDEVLASTLALFIPAEAGNGFDFVGKVRVFDSFWTKKPITLRMKVKLSFCEETQMHTAMFRVSPQDDGNEIWNQLAKVRLAAPCN